MKNKLNQEKMKGFDAMPKTVPGLSDLLHDLISKHGQTTLANQIGIDSSALSRFKNGEGNISLEHLEKLLSEADVILIERERYKRIIHSIITMNEFLKESYGW